MNRISVLHTPDRLRAFIKVAESDSESYPGEDDFLLMLRKHGITTGVKRDAISQMIAARTIGAAVEVASGKPAVVGLSGRLEYLIDTSGAGKPRQREDGGVDHRDLLFAVNVSSGTALVKHIPPVPGKPGMDVFGREIKVGAPLDETFKIGQGTQICADDPNLLEAAIDGALTIDAHGVVEVTTSRLVRGDVDYSTGNIVYCGSLKIIGTVRAGFSVRSDKDLTISGGMEDARAESETSIEIAGGAAGSGKGVLKAGTHVHVRYIENFSVSAGTDIVIDEDAIHCTLTAKGTIHARSIIGGETLVGAELECEAIGNSAEAKTVISVQGRNLLVAQREENLRLLTRLSTELATVRQAMFTLVKDNMDENGVLGSDYMVTLEESRARWSALEQQRAACQEKVTHLNGVLESLRPPTIAAGVMYPNTIIQYGEAEKDIKEKLVNAFVTFDKEQIVFSKRPYAPRLS